MGHPSVPLSFVPDTIRGNAIPQRGEKAAREPLHYGIKAMGAMTLRISELYLSFSPHPNISDGNFNLVHHFFRIQIFQINEKGSR